MQRRLHSSDAGQRFRAERQVLASLDHPNVAQLHGGGITEGGRPYLVMELVDGVPVTDYADENELSIDERVDLLRQVVDAVEAAHRQLVVHRDLKPSNVLVTETDDGTPQVKLLDFGIAKLLGDAVPVTRPQTATGRHLMTPSYAAPEQIAGADISTRTDVYQLGVLGYELLAGTRPFDLADERPTDIERIVTEEPPPKPSEAADENAETLRGDLDTILQKALRKEPDRRYQSAEALAADLEPYRARVPVEARTATLRYRTRKFVSRHRWGVGVAVAFFLLIVGAGTMLVQQRNRAQRNAERARSEAETAEQVSSYLVSLFEASDPLASTKNPSARELVDRGVERVQKLSDKPLVQAEMMTALGRAATQLGDWDQADSLLQRGLALRQKHLDAPHPDLVASLYYVGSYYRTTYDFARARSKFETALTMSRTVGDDQYRAGLLIGLANSVERVGSLDSAITHMRRAIQHPVQQRGPDYRRRPIDRMELARMLQRQGEHERAKTLFQSALQRMRSDTAQYSVGRRSLAHSNFALLLNKTGDYTKAEDHARTSLFLCERLTSPGNFQCRRTRTHLYGALVQQGKYSQAASVRRAQLESAKDKYDPPHYRLAIQYSLYGQVLSNTGQPKQGLPFLRRGAQMMRAYAESESIWTQKANLQHALGLVALGRLERARSLIRSARAAVNETHPDSTSLSLNRLNAMIAIGRGEIHARLDQWHQADSLLRRGYQLRRERVGHKAPLCQRALGTLVEVYESLDQPERAAVYRDSLVLSVTPW